MSLTKFPFLPKTIQLGRFKLRSNSDDEDDNSIASGSFFRQKQPATSSNETPKRSMAAACRDAKEALLIGGNSSASNQPKRQQPEAKAESTPVTKKIKISSENRERVAESLLSPSTSPFPKMKVQPKQEV